MINRVTIRYFKCFSSQTFDLSDPLLLAGPNNSGESTLLQAIAVWSLALNKWQEKRNPRARGKRRVGVALTRKEFAAIPLREMQSLWTNGRTAMSKHEAEIGKAGYPRVIEIELAGANGADSWSLAFEIRCQSNEQIYIRPAEKHVDNVPNAAWNTTVVHVPPFSGIGTEEARYDRAYQDLIIGQGKPGDLIRNLLMDVYEHGKWEELRTSIERIFQYRLLEPQHEGLPFITAEYLPGIPPGRGRGGYPRLDIASAGSGFHQVLMLLAFFYARPSSVLLLDEPDAHLHVILQKQIYDQLRAIAGDTKCQLIIATHSEVLINSTAPENILTFFQSPKRLVTKDQRAQVREALKNLTSVEVLLAKETERVLYVESVADFNLLAEWARICEHPVATWFDGRPFYHKLSTRSLRHANHHFFSLQAVTPKMQGFVLLDGDNRQEGEHESRGYLKIRRWRRYETENYLLHPAALERFVAKRAGEIWVSAAMEYLNDEMSNAAIADPLQENTYVKSVKASEEVLPVFFQKAGVDISKNEYYLIARQMSRSEIPPEVVDVLDDLYQIVQPTGTSAGV